MAVATPLISSAQDAGKADLKKVTSHLDMDGHYFMANNIDGDLAKLARLGNDFMQTAVKNGRKGIPENADLEALLSEMGGDQIFAYGRSAKFAGDHWVNRMFVQTNGSNKGILSFSGEKAQPFAVAAFAPEGSDAALEMNMDMRQVTNMMKAAQEVCNSPKSDRMTKAMSRQLPSGQTVEQMLNQLNLRVSVAMKMDDEKREKCPIYPEYTFPVIHTCMRIEGANTIWKEVGAMSKWMLKHDVQEDGTTLLTPFKMPKNGMMKDKKPVLLMDEENNVMWAASSIEFLTECRSDGAKLKDDAAFKAISGEMTEGNGLAYISKQACMEIRQVKETKLNKKDKKMLSDERIKMIMDHLTESKNGYFAAMAKSNDGIHMVLKAPCPVKDIMGHKGGKRYGKGHGKCGKSCSKCSKGKDRKKSYNKRGNWNKSKGNKAKADEDANRKMCKCRPNECKCNK